MRKGGRRRETQTLLCRTVLAPASISAFTASVLLFLAAAIRAVYFNCPPQEEREGHVTASHTALRRPHVETSMPQHVETSNTAHAIPSTRYPPLTHARANDGAA